MIGTEAGSKFSGIVVSAAASSSCWRVARDGPIEDLGVGVGVSDSSTSGSAWGSRDSAVMGTKVSSDPENKTRAFPEDLGSGTSAGVGVGVSLALDAARTGTRDLSEDVGSGICLG